MASVDAVKPARLLVVSDEMEVGGSQRQIVHLLLGLDRRRWQPTLLYFRTRSFLVDQLEAAGIETIYLSKNGRVDVGFIRRLAKFLREGNFDVIHAYSLTAELWVRALLPFIPRCAFVASVRGLCLGYPAWQWWLKRWIVRRADAVIANAYAGARMTAERTGYPLTGIDVVANGIDMPVLATARERAARRQDLGIAENRTLGLFVGRLVIEKNIPLLLDAMALIDPARRPVLLIAGDGPLATPTHERVQALSLADAVRLLGERDDARELMRCADFLVLPSREEGLSNVLLEAMAAGCAVLASAVGGNPELIDDARSGLLFISNDAADLARQLQRLTEQPSLRCALGVAARTKAQNDYSLPTLVQRTSDIYGRLLHDDRNTQARIR